MATIPANNNTGLYNTSVVPATTGNDLTVTGNVNANNINAVNTVNAGTDITAGGNVSAAYFIGDGSQLTNINAGNIVGSYGNANVAAYLASGSNSSNVVTTGNVSGAYILGDGSQLTGLPATYSNADVNSHLAAFGSNVISTTGNVTAGYFIGDGSQLTGLPASYGNAEVAAFLPTYTGNLAGGNATITTDLTVGGTIYGTFSGNISGNLVVPGANTEVIYNNNGNAGASANFTFDSATNILGVTGNVTATQFNGSGAGLTDLPAANITGTVANATYATSAGTASTATTATDAGHATVADSANTVAGANVTGTVASATDASHAIVADSANTVAGANVTGTVALANAATYAGTVTTAAQPNITSVGTLTSLTTSGNVDVGGSLNTDDITSTGDITLYGNQVITGNLTVQGTTTTINSNTITTNDKTITVANNQSTGANVNGAGLEAGNPAVATFLYDDATTSWQSNVGLTPIANATQTLGTSSLRWNYIYGNVVGDTVTSSSDLRVFANGANVNLVSPSMAMQNINMTATNVNVTGQLGVTGNITGSYILGNGSQLTGLPATYSDANVNTHLAAFGSNTIVTTGNITGGNIIGNGQALTNLPGANVVGAVANATYATSAGTATTATTAGTVTTAAQPAITSVGTLTSLGVTGNITAGGILTDGYYYANGTPVTFGGSTYGDSNVVSLLSAFGSNTISTTGTVTTGLLHAANIGSLADPVNVGWFNSLAATTSIVSNGTLSVAGNATVTGNVIAGHFIGDGSGLTGLSTYGNSNVSNFLAHYGSNIVSTTGNITGGNLIATAGLYGGAIESTGNINGVNLNLSGGIYAVGSSLTVEDINIDGNIIMNGGAGSGTSGANIDYINGGGYARFYGNVSSVSGYVISGGVTYERVDGTAGQVLATYGNGKTYWTTTSSSYGDSNVTTLLSAFGSNTISTTGNVTGGNLITSGQVVAGGNISGNYILGNGSALTGITASLSGSLAGNIDTGPYYIQRAGGEVLMGNVWVQGTLAANTISSPAGSFVTIEGVVASNGLITPGNVTGANITANASITAGTTIAATGNITGGNISTAGQLTTGAVTYTGTDGTSGQVLTTYGNGVTYFSTVSGGGGSPGGSDTQIQFNDGGSFAGNVAMTFSKTSGNIGLGNLIVNTQQIQTTSNASPATSTSLTPNAGRVVLGSGYYGNTSAAYDLGGTAGRSSRLLVSDTYDLTDANSVSRGASVQNFYTLSANVTGTNSRIGGLYGGFAVGGGAGANTISGSLYTLAGVTGSMTIGGGTGGNLTALGHTTAQYAVGVLGVPIINAGSTSGNLMLLEGSVVNNGTVNTAIGFGINSAGGGSFGNTYGVYMPGGTATYGMSMTNNARNSNYYFLKNDDNHSYSQLGQLSHFQEKEYALSSSGGAVTVDKSNGQVQFFTVSEDATMSFSNFVVSSTVVSTTRYQTDTVTVIVQQDATGRTITMPAASSTYKYAGGANTVPTTADSVSMISITAIYNSVTAATQYLITISPEFS